MQSPVELSRPARRRPWPLVVVAAVGVAIVATVAIDVALWPILVLLPALAVVGWLAARPSSAVARVSDLSGRREIEWYGLLAVEYARSPAERRLAVAEEFLRLAGDLLRLPPTNRHRWPAATRLNELRHQANLLLGSVVDAQAPVSLDDSGDDPDRPSGAELRQASTCLSRYAGLLAALATTARWDAETLRLITRERTRLDLAREEIAGALASPPLPARVDRRYRPRGLDARSDRPAGAPTVVVPSSGVAPAALGHEPPPYVVEAPAALDEAH